jgi:hypothetical protein
MTSSPAMRCRSTRKPSLLPGWGRPFARDIILPASVYRNIVVKYGKQSGVSAEVNGLCVHSLRATAATNALSHDADIAKVQK